MTDAKQRAGIIKQLEEMLEFAEEVGESMSELIERVLDDERARQVAALLRRVN